MTTDFSTTIADRFDIPTSLATAIVADLDHAIREGDLSATEVWADIAGDYAHQLPKHVDLERVIEVVSNHYGLTANLR